MSWQGEVILVVRHEVSGKTIWNLLICLSMTKHTASAYTQQPCSIIKNRLEKRPGWIKLSSLLRYSSKHNPFPKKQTPKRLVGKKSQVFCAKHQKYDSKRNVKLLSTQKEESYFLFEFYLKKKHVRILIIWNCNKRKKDTVTL